MSDRSRLAATVAAVVVVLGVAIITIGGGGEGRHDLKLRVSAALDITPGQEVRLAGSKVGSVDSVEADRGAALIGLKVDDDVWPLPAQTRARLRWGSTTAYEGRFVQLLPRGPAQPALSDGATIPASHVGAPVEFDQMYSIFNRDTRPQFQALLGDLSDTLRTRGPALQGALDRAPGGLEATGAVFQQLSRDRSALRTLVRSGAAATDAIARQEPQLRSLVSQAAGTFDEFADRAAPIQASLDRLPGTLRRTRAGLARLDQSIPGIQSLAVDVRPGAARLRALAPQLSQATQRLIDVAPTARRALRGASTHADAVTKLLTTGTPFATDAGKALDTFAPMAGCIRPYAPEIASFLATWAGYTSRFNVAGHYARALPPAQPVPHGTPLNSERALAATPPGSVQYAMPRPPGYNVGQTWFQPQCKAGPEALDAAKDPEAK